MTGHGHAALPGVTVDSYNVDVKEKREVLNHKLRKAAFFELLDELRAPLAEHGNDPFGKLGSSEIGAKRLAAHLDGEDELAVSLLKTAINAYAGDMALVLDHFLRTREWQEVERIGVGGGFRKTEIGRRCIARAHRRLADAGRDVELVPLRYHADDAGLIGGVHLLPSWMLKGHQGMLAVDIGGTNLRAGIVQLDRAGDGDLTKAEVWKSEIWRHADDAPSRTGTVDELIAMLKGFIRLAEGKGMDLAPVITIGCPGVIAPDGAILRGGENLPGGNWESEHFNLPAAILKGIDRIGEHEAIVRLHNDAVVQGLSQLPWMDDVTRWAVITIGTGLGNASYTNRG